MRESIICLQCGGIVGNGLPSESGEEFCRCAVSPQEVASIACTSCGGSLSVGVRACPYCGSTVATCRCPHCLAWNITQAQHCQACGEVLNEHSHDDTTLLEKNCPRCDSRLRARRYAELKVDECDQCGGLLISPAMMDAIVASRDAPTGLQLALPKRTHSRETTIRYLHCPGCSKAMNRKVFGRISGVIVDVCREHGVWFDPGELSEVLSFIERGGLELARQREREELAEKTRQVAADQARATARPIPDDGWHVHARIDSFGQAGAELLQALTDLWRGIR